MVNVGKYTTWMVWAKWVDNLFMFMVFHSTYLFGFSFYGKCVGQYTVRPMDAIGKDFV